MAGHDQNPTIGQLPNRDIKYTYSSYQNVEDVQCSYNYRLRVCVFNIYYTDMHDADEDLKTISAYGGHWNEKRTGAGIAQRYLAIPWTTVEIVASKKK